MACASSTAEVQYFAPFSSHPSPVGVAVVVMRWVLVPASGSVMANDILTVPSARPGSQRSCSSVVPYASMIGEQIDCRTMVNSGQPCADVSSTTM